jgi:hypothetical protein
VVVDWFGFDNDKGLKQYPSTRKRTLAVIRAEEIVNKSRRMLEMLSS